MPDSAQEKTEAPTPRRREEARKGGQVGRSADLSAALVLLGTLVVLEIYGGEVFGKLLAITRTCLGATGQEAVDPTQMMIALGGSFKIMAMILLPMLAVVAVLALLAGVLQVGFLISFKPITPSLDKMNPINGLKRMFGAKAFVHLLMGLAKMTLLSAVAFWTLKSRVGAFAFASEWHHMAIVQLGASLIFTLGLRLAIVLLVLALLDFAYQKYKHEREMYMTQQEIRDEMKNMEGDPKVKQQRRQAQMQMALHRVAAAVPQADVVVTNPTELAIAIKYDPETMVAPKIVAKGGDFMAMRIRQLAISHGVPIVERKPLARALYKSVEVGQEVPAEFYRAVAEVLAYVYELSGKKPRSRKNAGVA